MLLPEWIIFYMAVAGGAALILGARRVAAGLLSPAIFHWFVFPVIKPEFHQLPLPLIIVAAPIVLILGGLLVLNRGIRLLYGHDAGGHVVGTYLVRIIDGAARALLLMAFLPFRILGKLLR